MQRPLELWCGFYQRLTPDSHQLHVTLIICLAFLLEEAEDRMLFSRWFQTGREIRCKSERFPRFCQTPKRTVLCQLYAQLIISKIGGTKLLDQHAYSTANSPTQREPFKPFSYIRLFQLDGPIR